MVWGVEVSLRPEIHDPLAVTLVEAARELSFPPPPPVTVSTLFLIHADLERAAVERAARELLCDPVTETFRVLQERIEAEPGAVTATVLRRPGVMDPAEASTQRALATLGVDVKGVRTAKRLVFRGQYPQAELDRLVRKTVANEVVDEVHFGTYELRKLAPGAPYTFVLHHVALLGVPDERLAEIGRPLSLNAEEMRAIRDHFATVGREPTEAEIETIAQTWSEHCKHKTLTGTIDYKGVRIENLLKTTIFRATQELKKPWCLSVFEDNAGVIEFDDDWAVCFKVETHNHPSAIEPYGGAGTGVGGVIRDILGCGLGARPILNTDVFCVGLPDVAPDRVPVGALHPRRVLRGVVAGVRDYGNRMGIPTASGAVYFDERYMGNPLVYCGTVGILPIDKVRKAARPGDVIVVVGGRTGRDGIHGATFSSAELTTESERLSGGAVQIGNAIEEKKVLDTLLTARDRGLYTAITDCGAGGLSSAIGEMGRKLGAVVDLEKVPLKYEGLSPTEIWISEAQERMVIAVPPDQLNQALWVFGVEGVEATPIGRFTQDQRLVLRYHGHGVADLDMKFLHDGLPDTPRPATWSARPQAEPAIQPQADYGPMLERLLAHPTTASKEWIIRQYDHEVQGGSALKPLVGARSDGPGDATVVRPILGSSRGIAIACGANPRYGDLDPYAMAASAIDEAVRNVIAVGGSLDRIALLDNFSWGNPNDPEVLGALVRAAQACYDVSKGYGIPFISGKDSLNNEFVLERGADGRPTRVLRIPHTLLISAIGIIPDVHKVVSMDLKAPGNPVYLVGSTTAALGGSQYYHLHGALGNQVPDLDLATGKEIHTAMAHATARGLVRSCHDLSEGGLAVAAAEMAFAGDIGLELELKAVPSATDARRDDVLLFSESNARFLVEVDRKHQEKFEELMWTSLSAGRSAPGITDPTGSTWGLAGWTTAEKRLKIHGLGGQAVIDRPLDALLRAWKTPILG